MRILYQCNCFLLSVIGGTEVLSYHLVKELRRRGYEILVVTGRAKTDSVGRQAFDGLDLVRLDFDAAVASRSLPALRAVNGEVAELVKDFRPDILHLNDSGLVSFFFFRGGATGNMPRLLTLHSPIRPAGKDSLQSRLAAEADRVVTVSQASYATAAAAMPAVRGKMSVIPNALPLPDLPPAALPFAPPALLCIGRLIPEKGFDFALRAFALVCARGIAATLTIAGNGTERDSLESLARELGVADRIQFTDWVMPDRVASLINTATLVLMPSRWPEPFGLVALQAAQMGRPTIATAVGGLPEIVEHGLTGLLVERKNEHALADAIQALLSDPPAARRMGENARRRAREKFDFAVMVGAYEQAFAETQEAAARPRQDGARVA